jgi:hypothetical protein
MILVIVVHVIAIFGMSDQINPDWEHKDNIYPRFTCKYCKKESKKRCYTF